MKRYFLNPFSITLFLFIFQLNSLAQDGALDLTFGTDGIVLTDIGVIDEVRTLARQDDGKLVTGGFTGTIGAYSFLLIRYNEDGSLDETFGVDGVTTTSLGLGEASCNSIRIQEDGKIIVVGVYLLAEEGPSDIAMARYNSDGTLDVSFGTDGIVITNSEDSEVWDGGMRVEIQADGKLLVMAFNYEDDLEFLLLRYNTDGTLDDTFGDEGIVAPIIGSYSDESEGLNILFDGDENILVVSSAFGMGESHVNFSIVKYDSDGDLDLTFGTDGQVLTNIMVTDGISSNDYGSDIAFQSDGKLVVGGMIYDEEGAFAVARYSAAGTLDESFGTDGVVFTEMPAWTECTSMLIQSNDKIILLGHAAFEEYNEEFVMARYTANGVLDPTFGVDGLVKTDLSPSPDYAEDFLIINNEKILVTGTEGGDFGVHSRVALAQYLIDYELSTVEYDVSEQNMAIYPNPFNDFTTVHFDEVLTGNNTIVMYDLLGQQVYRTENITGNELQIDRAQLQAGLYLLTFKEMDTTEKVFVSKLIVE
ncbi:MAG: T9SS type A sorting domain-containing protein [Crocinitomix sp.]|nr:T9SS type A sorting domain-containing protein [Crocinitomix sp.]